MNITPDLIRVSDPSIVREALELYPFEAIDLDVENWLLNPSNLALSSDEGSLALFEFVRPGLYDGHYFFKCRGKQALTLAEQILKTMYQIYGAKVIRGFTPVKHKPAIWMSRQLGFKDTGEVPTEIGPCKLFIMNLDLHFNDKDVNI